MRVSGRHKDLGLLVLRVGLGLMFILHGYSKITGGVEEWRWLGSQMGHLGINFLPVFWGFMAALAEFAGGILLLVGLFTRPAAIFMAFTMLVAMLYKLESSGVGEASHAIEALTAFLAIYLIGPGKYSIDQFRR